VRRFSLPTAACAAALTALLSAVAPAFAGPRLVAYYPWYAKWQTPSYTAAQIPYGELTHIMHAFAEPSPTGKLTLPKGLVEKALISDAHAAGVKVSISIGGAGANHAKAFSKLAASAKTRAAFVANVAAFVSKYGYDGIDIDWEVPNAPKDTQNCLALMAALRAQFPAPQYTISMATPADPQISGTGLDIPHLAQYLDFFNVMTYDFTGPWEPFAGENSPLYQSPNDPWQTGSLQTSMILYTGTYGISPAQLNIGTAFYGYQFDTVDTLWGKCSTNPCGNNVTTPDYGNYIKQLVGAKGWKAFVDQTSDARYLVNTTTNQYISYDDPQSTTDKVAYVIGQSGFGGMFMWDLSGDYDGQGQDLLTAMYNEYQALGFTKRQPGYGSPFLRFAP
jgi:chitinase